jgi:hypothetical protein
MNVLYIDHYAGSEFYGMEFRPFYLAKEWCRKGINTTIIAADYSHLRKENPHISVDFVEIKLEGINYCWIKTRKYDGNGLSRVLNMLQFVSKLILNAKKIADKYKPDVVICSSTYPLDTYPGQLISKYSNAKLIHEIHDLWPLTPMELGGYSKNHPFIKIMQLAEKSAYKKSSLIVSILPNVEPYLNILNIQKRVVVIPNGVILDKIDELAQANKKIQNDIIKLKENGYFVIGYAGGISVSNAMIDLMKAAKLLIDKKIAFLIIGNGTEKEKLIMYKETYDLQNVLFYESISKKEIYNTLAEMDALYIGSKKTKLYKYGVSANKIFDYMLTGKPIINAIDTEHSPLNYNGNSFVAESENIISIKETIEKVIDLSKEDLDYIKESTVRYVINNYNYEKIADDFAKEIVNVSL